MVWGGISSPKIHIKQIQQTKYDFDFFGEILEILEEKKYFQQN